MTTNNDKAYSKLRRFNMIMGFLHLVQGGIHVGRQQRYHLSRLYKFSQF